MMGRRANATLAMLVTLTLIVGGLSYFIPSFFEATARIERANRTKHAIQTVKQGLQQFYYSNLGKSQGAVHRYPDHENDTEMQKLWQIIGKEKAKNIRELIRYRYNRSEDEAPQAIIKTSEFGETERKKMRDLYEKYIPFYTRPDKPGGKDIVPIMPQETMVNVQQQSQSWSKLQERLEKSDTGKLAAKMTYKTVTKFPENEWDWFMGYTSREHAQNCHLSGSGCFKSTAVPRESLMDFRGYAHGHPLCGCMHKGCTFDRDKERRIRFELVDLDNYPKRNWPRREIFIRTNMDWEQFMSGPWVYNAFTNVSRGYVVPFTTVNQFMQDEKPIRAPFNWESPRFSQASVPFKLWERSNFNIRYNSLRTMLEYDPETNKIYFVSVLSSPYYMPWVRFNEVTIAWR